MDEDVSDDGPAPRIVLIPAGRGGRASQVRLRRRRGGRDLPIPARAQVLHGDRDGRERLQSGRLDAYLLYMLIALIAIIAVVTALA